MEGKLLVQRSCHRCKTPNCIGDFKKIAALQNSGLHIYVHKDTESSDLKPRVKNKDETYILHNSSERELKRPDYIKEMCQYRSKCYQCRTTIQRVQSLLDEITDINKNEAIGVCEYCKSLNPGGKCKRCEYLVGKFICCRAKLHQDTEQRFKTWLCKVYKFLQSTLGREDVCMNRLNRPSMDELEKLLQELKSPLAMRQPKISSFPKTEAGQVVLPQDKDMLDELIYLMKSADKLRTITEDAHPSFMDKKLEDSRSLEKLPHEPRFSSEEEKKKYEIEHKTSTEDSPGPKSEQRTKVSGEDNRGFRLKQQVTKDGIKPKTTQTVGKFRPKVTNTLKCMNIDSKNTKARRLKYLKKGMKVQKPMPEINEKTPDVEDSTGSILECEDPVVRRKKMIQGTTLVKLDPRYKDETPPNLVPLMYEVQPIFEDDREKIEDPPSPTTVTSTTNGSPKKLKNQTEIIQRSSLIYKLSDRTFIDKGWTIMPTTKMMRRMNFYKMLPACPQFDWFEHNKNKQIKYYDSGEKLAEISDDSNGKWFYKNGLVALDFYSAEEINAGQRCIVYSSGEDVQEGRSCPRTVLACFDYLGNGVVYDNRGKERLKYNQTEGVLFDEKIGPLSRWQWHSLNDPPVLVPVFVDTHDAHPDPCLRELQRKKEEKRTKPVTPVNDERIAVELENFAKEKAQKLLTNYKPFQIRMKALKINNQFSLRILDQANIYLLFRYGHMFLKMNLGMLLINTEIIYSKKLDITDVATPYDQLPPLTDSVADIQDAVRKARRVDCIRQERNRRLINNIPIRRDIKDKSPHKSG